MIAAYAQEVPAADPADTPAAIDHLQATAPETVDQAIRLDPAFFLSKIEAWVVGFQRLLPNLIVALVFLVLAYLVGWAVERAFAKWAKRHNRSNLGAVLGSFLRWLIVLFGILICLTIVLPSLKPADLLAGLGIGSVAIGFAFKDILQNWLAGLLILIQRPFHVGDQIVVKGYEGTVEWIETRATIIKTYDGRRAIIPNADVYSNAVTVNTAYETRRSQYDLGIGNGDSIAKAREVIFAALADVEGVRPDPKPEVLTWAIADFSVVLRVRWWTASKRSDVVHIQANVIEALKEALDKAGIDMPYPTMTLLFHDQTDEFDAIRGRQREGWPVRPGEELPRPARVLSRLEDERPARG